MKLLAKLALLAVGAFRLTSAVTLSVSTARGNASSPLLYGLMFEVCISLRNPLILLKR